ncbi:efflux transporter outer membrane subunit [Aquitalea magnusonii]|uniref:NodT family efflux transporter outer membrane factor (OMF) lipoprotein n=2 Tax=Aquitalea magnusonii TaxID=332411 RepID=A0A318J4S2_9NEIS|nr:efflux transporter outer membrane subunit [Aquitalea magnusonii]PXX41327.1 NodT family efflux transporter outer membrane factor (OMF) lipoprotein [Aquitalea magnusonii]
MHAPSPLTAGLLTSLSLLLAACSAIGPDYQRPAQPDLPTQWKDQGTWQAARPADQLPKQAWWQQFGDATLNRLEQDCIAHNATLAQALARLQQAQAQAGLHAAATLPSVGVGMSASRSRISADRPLSNYNSPNSSTIQNDYKPTLSVSYEFDWLGRVRRDVESASASAEQSRADSENVRLLLTAQLASAYFQLRQLDEESTLLRQSISLQEKVLQLTRVRHQEGLDNASALATQQAALQAAQAQLSLLGNQRRQQEDLLATLSGQPAAAFSLSQGSLPAQLPAIGGGLPAQLLERRPDIAAAERAMAAANAQIGVAKAAWFPQLNLNPGYVGYESNRLGNLVSAPALIWSLGLQASQMLFDNGKTQAAVRYAEAGYQATTASYRQTVLQAIQESQDALSTLHGLSEANASQQQAVDSQRKAYELSLLRYREGLDNALTLAINQQNLLAAQRLQSQLRGSQFVWSVSLLKALGGDWQATTAN